MPPPTRASGSATSRPGSAPTYTADTLRALRRRFPRTRFVWLMGGDNLAQFPYWRRWQAIFRAVPIAVFARPGSSQKALAGDRGASLRAGARAGAAARRLAAEDHPRPGCFFTPGSTPARPRRSAPRESFTPSRRTEPEVTPETTAVATPWPCPAAAAARADAARTAAPHHRQPRRRQGRGDRDDRPRRQNHDRRLHGHRLRPLGAASGLADRPSGAGACRAASRSRARRRANGC